ncbi:MAG: hypothetical protein IPN17_19715 [Deltaproteobacteria bacterium]|nr:hypothetical protein [Deltaproteobacteria bacterium]
MRGSSSWGTGKACSAAMTAGRVSGGKSPSGAAPALALTLATAWSMGAPHTRWQKPSMNSPSR